MNCQQAQILFGVRAELDGPTRRAIDAHLAQCPVCAAASQAEREFERLMAKRSLPSFAQEPKRALLKTPPPGLLRLQLRLWLAKLAPALAVTALLITGALVASLVTGGDWDTVLRPDERSGSAESGASGVGPSAALPGRIGEAGALASPVPTRVLRLSPNLAVAVNRVAATPQSRRVAALDRADSAVPTSRGPAQGPSGGGPAGLRADATATPPPAPSATPSLPNPDDDEGGVDDEAPPHDTGQDAGPTDTPPATQPVATPFVQLHISAVADVAGGSETCPGCDLNIVQADRDAARDLPMGDIQVEIVRLSESGSDDGRMTIVLDPVEPGAARASVRIDPGVTWRVRLLQAPGFVPCPAAGTERILEVSPDDGPAAVSFFLGLECPSP